MESALQVQATKSDIVELLRGVEIIPGTQINADAFLLAAGIDVLADRIEGFNDKVDKLHALMGNLPSVDLPVTNTITPGLYSRACSAPRGTILISQIHKNEHQFVMTGGSCTVITEEGSRFLVGPCAGVTKAGTRRVVVLHDDTTQITFHPTSEKSVHLIEKEIFEKRRPSPELVKEAREDFAAMVRELGTTIEQVRKESVRLDYMTPMPEGEGLKIEIAPSAIEGDGIFAKSDIGSGERIAPAAIRCERTIAGRWTNHSHKPNAVMVSVGNGSVDLVASEKINGGEEITVDYRNARSAALKSQSTIK